MLVWMEEQMNKKTEIFMIMYFKALKPALFPVFPSYWDEDSFMNLFFSAIKLEHLLREDSEAKVISSQLPRLHEIYSPSSQRVFNVMILQPQGSHNYLDMNRHSPA